MQAAEGKGYEKADVLYMALELSGKSWRIGFAGPSGTRQVTVSAGDREGVLKEIRRMRSKLGVSDSGAIHSCYEAGRDGFWIHRWLSSQGIENVVVDAASIEVPQRARRRKTDRIDAQQLLRLLQRWQGGDQRALSLVRVPDEQAEDARRLHRERDRLLREINGHSNRITSLLSTQGVQLKLQEDFPRRLEQVQLWDGGGLRAGLRAELLREWQRLAQAREQLHQVESEQHQQLQQDPLMQQLLRMRSIGQQGACKLAREIFGWREFSNRRELAGYAGLAPTPFNSGGSAREQGISKAGNKRVRSLMVELAWLWLKYQPQSHLSQWYRRRFAEGASRMRRIGIVAMAWRLLIDLWRYVREGVIPPGAQLKSCSG
jgi:transposase